MTHRKAYFAGEPISLVEPGLSILLEEGASADTIDWYTKITSTIQAKSWALWQAGGDDPYVESVNDWAKIFYRTVCQHDKDKLKHFKLVVDTNFKPLLYWLQQQKPDFKTDRYNKIIQFKWTGCAGAPTLM